MAQRAELNNALKFVRDGDVLVVAWLDRLARSTKHLLEIVEELDEKNVALRILDFGGAALDTKSPTGKMMLTMFGVMAEYERSLMKERQLDGIEKAKVEGRYKGRALVPDAKVKQARIMKEQGLKPAEIWKELLLGRLTVYRLLSAAKQWIQVQYTQN